MAVGVNGEAAPGMGNTAWGATLRDRTVDSDTANRSGSQPGGTQQARGSRCGAQEEI